MDGNLGETFNSALSMRWISKLFAHMHKFGEILFSKNTLWAICVRQAAAVSPTYPRQ
jgi:hypothetical protein